MLDITCHELYSHNPVQAQGKQIFQVTVRVIFSADREQYVQTPGQLRIIAWSHESLTSAWVPRPILCHFYTEFTQQ